MDDIESAEQQLIVAIRPKLLELLGIWNYVGYDAQERSERIRGVGQKLHLSMDIVITEENAARLSVERQIECSRREVSDLCQQLRLPSFFPDRGLSPSELVKTLDAKGNELKRLKQTRRDHYVELRSKLIRLSQQLKEPQDTIDGRLEKFPPLPTELGGATNISAGDQPDQLSTDKTADYSRIPDENELKLLTEAVEQLDSIYAPLAAKHAALREDISRIAADIHYRPQDEREVELLKAIGLAYLCPDQPSPNTPGVVRKVNDSSSCSKLNVPKEVEHKSQSAAVHEPVVDNETLQWLTDLRLRLVKEKARLVGTCDELRAYLSGMWRRLGKPMEEQREFLLQHSCYWPETLDALQEEVDRCQQLKWEHLDIYLNQLTLEARQLALSCCMDENVVQLPPGHDSDDPEVVAHHLETLLERLNEVYGKHKPIYDSISAYEEMWKGLLEVELRLKDPTIFLNRGGILLKTEKEKKRLTKEVLRAEQEVLGVIEQYEMSTKSTFSLPDGRSFRDHLSERWSSTKTSRDTSRARRSIVPSIRPNSANLSGPPGAPV